MPDIVGGHWYDADAQPCHTVPSKKDGTPRKTTLADAKKLGLFPSVTTVLNVLDKPALTSWKVTQAVKYAFTHRPMDGEDAAGYAARCAAAAHETTTEAAADEGTRIHQAIENAFTGHPVPDAYDLHADQAMRAVVKLIGHVDDWVSERTMVHATHGYGGTVDLYSPSANVVLDWKTKDFDDPKKKMAYDQHVQLAAYAEGLGMPNARIINGFVSRTVPGLVVLHEWLPEQRVHGWDVFKKAASLWRVLHRYDPRQR